MLELTEVLHHEVVATTATDHQVAAVQALVAVTEALEVVLEARRLAASEVQGVPLEAPAVRHALPHRVEEEGIKFQNKKLC